MFSIENENTLKESLKNRINFFLGAGFPLLAYNKEKLPMPLGHELVKELIIYFKLKGMETLSLPEVCTILESTKKDTLYKYLINRFSVDTFDDRYKILDSINIENIFTTNIDNLIYKLYIESSSNYINDITCFGPVLNDKFAIDYIPLHGSILHEGQKFIFSSTDIAATFSHDPDRWFFLENRLERIPTLFWGYSLSDAGILKVLDFESSRKRSSQMKWIILHEKNEAHIQYFKALKFSIIISDTENFLDYLNSLDLKKERKKPKTKRTSKELFPDECIPDISTVPVRPIFEFYLGSEPTWYDIFSGQIHKTSHYYKILDSINSKKHSLIIGIPASGKSTLLMQVANDLNFEGHKLVTNYLSYEKALLIQKRLGTDKCVIFIDNFSDCINAVNLLIDSDNILVVGSDRDYNFENCSHLFDKDRFKIISITELSESDIQEIFSRIPPNRKKDSYVEPNVEYGVSPSIYEVVETNMIGPTLSKRYRSVLDQLIRESETLHDFFVMVAYVHSCRTPVSFDMAYAFLRNDVVEYNDVFEFIENCGKMITDYSGYLIDSEQDHFVPRSILISEAVLKAVSQDSLNRVIHRFHKEVSPYRICNYDIFKRRAFDASFAKKAFPDWREGKEFYSNMYERDKSPFLLQQGALYLSQKHKYTDAFSWIDQAVLETENRIPSIRNSHAIILFRSNIHADKDNPTVQHTLKQSMNILQECHQYDRRKTYHALVFADQALQYWNIYNDDTAKDFLIMALKWLKDEMKISYWNRNVKRLFHLVDSKIKEINNSV